MKAIICSENTDLSGLSYRDLEDPAPKPGEVVVEIRAAYTSFTDLLQVKGKYQIKATPPFVVGSEFSGLISVMGEGVENYQVGDHVLGLKLTGAYAEQCAIHVNNIFPAPAELDDRQLVCLLSSGTTAYYALVYRGNLGAGETLLITGAAGAVGLCGIQIAKALGARVIAACSSDDKLALAKQYGADVLINYQTQDLRSAIREATDNRGVDVALELVGGEVFDLITRCMAAYGRLLVTGFASGDIPRVRANLPLLKEYTIVGVNIGHHSENNPEAKAKLVREVTELCKAGKLHTHIDGEFALSDAAKVLSLYEQRTLKGKALLRP